MSAKYESNDAKKSCQFFKANNSVPIGMTLNTNSD